MMLSKIIKYKKFFVNNLYEIQRLILFLAFVSLFNINPKPNKIFTDQFLHEFVTKPKNVFLDYKNINEFDFANKEFRIGNDSCAKTILIEGDLKNIVQLLTIYTTLKEAKYLHRSIVIKVNENGFFNRYSKYFCTNKFAIFKKRFEQEIDVQNDYVTCKNNKIPFEILKQHFCCKIKLEDDKKTYLKHNNFFLYKNLLHDCLSKFLQPENSKYFAVLRLNFSNKTHVKIDMLKNYMLNSDLLFVAKHFFDSKLIYNFKHIFVTNFEINTLKISLKSNIESYKNLLTLVRCINNLHSYSLGNYYYVPFYKTHISLLQAFPFIVLMFIYFGIEYCFSIINENLETYMVFTSIMYLFCPLVFVILIIFYKKSPAKNSFFVLFFSFVNFRFGFVYTMILFFMNIHRTKKAQFQ